jgi:hypothetical protein
VTRVVLFVVVSVLGLASCGYRPLYGGERGDERFSVIGVTPLVVDASVVSEVQAGVRSGLARGGALRGGNEYPRVIVEVLRIDATSEGIQALPGGTRGTTVGGLPISPGGPLAPLARGTRIGVLARAWVERAPGAARERETGDLRTADVMQTESDARLEVLRLDDTSRAAARRLGERLARRVLGEPDAPDDGM